MRKSPELSGDLSKLIEPLLSGVSIDDEDKNNLIRLCEDLVIDDVQQPIIDSRSPRLYLVGRSGAGKSSFVNALANKQIAETGSVEPTTDGATLHKLSREDVGWDIVDSRGLFESVPVDGDNDVDTVRKFRRDLTEFDPDLLIHLLTPEQLRAGNDDFRTLRNTNESIPGGLPPRILCLNKIDAYAGPHSEWPPERNPDLCRRITRALELAVDVLSIEETHAYDEELPARGMIFESKTILGAFPTYLKQQPYWNFSTVVEFLCEYMPTEALLQAVRNDRRERLLRRIARRQSLAIAKQIESLSNEHQINFSGSISIQGLLIPILQRFLVGLIASFAGRDLGIEPVEEYFEYVDSPNVFNQHIPAIINIARDFLLIHSGQLEYHASYTYAIGRSAEVYFFDSRFEPPSQYIDD